MTKTLTQTPWKVIGTHHPSTRKAWKTGKYITGITKKLGLVPLKNDEIQRNANPSWEDYDLHAEVRRYAVPGSEGTQWHQDGDTSTPDRMDFAIVLWTEHSPTELKDMDGNIYSIEPYDIVIFKNLDVYHRRPPQVEGKRLSFRQRVEVPDWL